VLASIQGGFDVLIGEACFATSRLANTMVSVMVSMRLTGLEVNAKTAGQGGRLVIIPYSTDAPIYHYPKATLGVIVANVAVHIAWCYLPPESAEPFAMKLGAGLHPLQWLTHNFLHADFLHLIFNMVFLWSYGIIVEGKVGWLPFLLIYAGIGMAHGAAIQAMYLNAAEPTYVLGASAIIFGLMAICMIWAPMNELSCLFVLLTGFRVISHVFEIRIYVLALLQLFLEGLSVILQFMIRGDPMSSGLLHISGAFWGVIAGILLVKAGWVDCEGWDVFSLMQKRRALRVAWESREARLDRARENQTLPQSRRSEEDRPGLSSEERAAKLLAKMHRSIETGDITAAEAAFEKWMVASANRPSTEALRAVVKALHGREEWAASVPPMRALCRLYPDKSEKARLKLASILIRELGRPTEARRQLLQIRHEGLDPSLQRFRQALLKEAEQMIEDGVLEVEEDV
jgi:membrane associated rhomboid family serine protease